MLKRNPDAPIFCDGPDDAPAGVCAHCGGASDADYCGLECRLKASEAASAKRIAALEAKLEELSAKERMREGAERALQEEKWLREDAEAAAQKAWVLNPAEVRARMEAHVRERERLLGPYDHYLSGMCNCIPSRASLLTRRRESVPTPRESEIAERALKNGDRSPLTNCVDWVNATVARFSALGGAAD
jgi:hypothetical protein